MKKILLLLLSAFILLSFTACKSSEKTATDEPFAVEEIEADPFYLEMKSKENVRPIALMIDNDTDAARPQIGLEDAYMVYEIVVEGRATRFMALFKDFDLEKVGPVRSSRHYFLDYAQEHDAIYAHAGWSPKAAKDISALGINNINGVAGDGAIFWRDNTYDKTWHNLYTSTQKLSSRADEKNYRRDTENNMPNYKELDETPSGGTAVSSITIPYANFYTVGYEYDEETKVFVRYVNGKTHNSQTGKAITAKNIIMYTVQNVNLPDTENKGRQDLKNIGSGTGYYFSDGQVVEINWKKSSREAKTEYTLKDGTPLKLNPGNTFIQIVPTYAEAKITYPEVTQ
ncbi:MAG: DUF3048 domain-containing protein [Clostridia bacterium]|nr:DUF3048 domain-containing protein [Clostridia bacterium]